MSKKRIGSCNRCGNCCRDFIIDINVSGTTDFEFTDYLRWINGHVDVRADIKSFKGRTAELRINSPCKYLVENSDGTWGCAIQDEKPEICKRYPEEEYTDEIGKKCGFRFVDAQGRPD